MSQAEKVKELHETYLPAHITLFEKMAAANGAPEGWIWGDKVTSRLMPFQIHTQSQQNGATQP